MFFETLINWLFFCFSQLLTFEYILFWHWHFQQWMRNIRGHFLEVGRLTELCAGPSLAWPRVRQPSQPETEGYGGRHDRVQHSQVGGQHKSLRMSLQINIYRTFAAFESQLNKGILLDATTYVLPSEICSMVNVVLDAKNQSVKLCAADGVDRVRFSSSYPIMERNIIITSYVSAQIPLKDWRQHWENLNQHEAPSMREANNCAGEDSGKAFLIWWRKCHRNAAGICGNKVSKLNLFSLCSVLANVTIITV